MSGGISSVVIRGVGRRILGLFFLAALLPVIFTAFLAYHEVGRGLEQKVSRELREFSKAYGVDILTRLKSASDKATELIRIVEANGIAAIQDRQYLLDGFTSISVMSPNFPAASIYGVQPDPMSASAINFDHLATGKSQLLESQGFGGNDLILLRGENIGQASQAVFAFHLNSKSIWGPIENLPYSTEFCIFSSSGSALHCTADMDASIIEKFSGIQYPGDNRPVKAAVGDEQHLAAIWELFLEAQFSLPAIDIVASQPKNYALRSGADFRRIFPPALILVIVLVGALSFNLIGQSLVPLQRLTIVARQFAAGDLKSRVRIRTGDEFESSGRLPQYGNCSSKLSLTTRQSKSLPASQKTMH